MTELSPKDAQAPPARTDERRRRAISRSNCYGLLALVFRDRPTPQTLAQLRSPPLCTALRQIGYAAADELGGDLGAVAARLAEEHTRLFIGPGNHVPPYASVHHEGEGRLWGDSTVRAKRLIEAAGLSIQGAWEGIPDHLAIELELMQRLAAHEAELWARAAAARARGDGSAREALGRCRQAQTELLRAHLCAWVPQFCDRVSEAAAAPFYREMARVAKALILSDAEEMAAAPNAT